MAQLTVNDEDEKNLQDPEKMKSIFFSDSNDPCQSSYYDSSHSSSHTANNPLTHPEAFLPHFHEFHIEKNTGTHNLNQVNQQVDCCATNSDSCWAARKYAGIGFCLRLSWMNQRRQRLPKFLLCQWQVQVGNGNLFIRLATPWVPVR